MSDVANTELPLPIRVGGAFVAVAIVLVIFTFVAVVTQGFLVPFDVTPRFLLIVVAAAILGGFGMTAPGQPRSAWSVFALAVALLLVVGGRFIPNDPLYTMEQWWLPAYAMLAILCGLVLRRAAVR
ncbi:hypothetical protein CKALI_05785 [Corynebacterium kalinowskii]|uniref:Uncharacterized protein n=1 Tax=Corynebacterium kalinowskii TaxID=2675216 RepID=A0A6B8VR10_9CORY|nr:hypothetical protein [Corynebacterium kalinowskii]QGU02027.1 hypothetical protein CKALI_05785 [Corynebacterium kalinowskii]